MAKGDGVARMEIDQNSSASDQISNPKFSINVLQLLKSAQMQHGLRFSDYTRYRRYCTARLRRLYKSLKFTHGRGKYTKRAISSSTVTEVRYLHLVLYTAERAWSHAMEKKTLPDGPNARQRSYLIGRLKKAVKWATQFQELCAIRGDSRTSLEAEAYASYMKGCLLFEQDEHWDIALKCFKSARAVYEELGKYGDLENQVLCRERVEELEPSIRYCLHKVGESNLRTSELVQIGEMEGPALDLFKAKLEAVMAEARSQQAASLTEFHWLGHRFPISNAKTRVAILKAQELEKDINGPGADSVPAEKKLAIFDKIFAAYSEARSCIRNDLANTGNSESIKDDLSGLDKAIGAVLGERTIERNQLLVHIAKNKLSKVRDDKNENITKPEELVRLYDLLLQNAADLSDLVSSGRDRKSEEVALSEECELKSLVFRAERCFYLAKSYSLAGKRVEAYALFCRARTLVDDALKKLQSSTNADQVAIKELKTLYNDCRSNICIEHATGVMEEEKAPENLSKKISSISLTGNDKKAARQLEFFRGRNKSGPTTDSLADAMAIAQHHDAVTGTEKQHVANDYAKRLSIGYEESKDVVAASLGCLTQSSSSSECKTPVTNFKQCPLLNISYCPATEVDLSVGKKLAVLVYNPLGWKRTSVVRIPVINENLSVSDSTGKLILSQLLPIVNASVSTRKFYASAYTGESPSLVPKYWLAFEAVVLPLGFSTYVISSSQSSASTKLVPETFRMGQNDSIEVGPGDLKLIYSGKDGKLAQYSNGRNSANIDVEQSYSYYVGATDELQASGAYVFRPNGTYTIQSEEKIPLRVFKGPLYDEVHQTFSPWVYQITRVYKDKEHAEIEFTVGPIPIDDGKGKEIVTQIKTNIGNNKTFYTDSNGRDFLERIRDYRADWNLEVNQPIAGNYYPINLGIYMKDESTEMSVLVDRSVGGSSITDGEVEIMLHRRLLKDDGRGVDEALNETVCALDTCTGLKVQGKYYLRFDPLGEGSKWRRSFGQEIYSPFLLAFSEQEDKWTNFPTPTFSAMDSSYSLPDNVAILTLQELEDGEVLLRLAHLYEVGEDKDLSSLANVELKRVFPNRKINKIKEMSLSANQEREEMERKRLSWKVEGSNTKSSSDSRGGPIDPSKLVVELAPMEVRTFIIDFNSNLLKY